MLAAIANRTDLLDADTSTVALVLLLLVGVAGWYALHRWRQRLFVGLWLGLAGFAGRVLVGMLTLWAAYQITARVLVLETNWALWTHGFLGALVAELIFILYAWERTLVSPRLGRWLLGLRLGALGALLIMLLQPVFAKDKLSERRREVIVLLDDSGSMHIADKQMTVAEKMELAQFAGIAGITDRPPLTPAFDRLRALSLEMQSLAKLLDLPDDYGPEVAQAAMEKEKERITKLRADIADAGKALKDALDKDRKNLDGDAKELLRETRRNVEEKLPASLEEWQKAMDEDSENPAFTLRSAVRRTQVFVDQLATRGKALIAVSDAAFYADVPAATRAQVDAQASRTRAEIAREALQRKHGDTSLMEALKAKYGNARILHFGQKVVETPTLEAPSTAADELRVRTDLAGALKFIDEQFDENSLAGVLLVSDARHNGDVPVDDAARNLGRKGAPIGTMLVGSQQGVKDAAIITVGAPQAIFEGDKLRARVEVKADGLRGQKLSAALLENGQEVMKQEVTVADDVFRTTLRLAHQPKAAGIYNYTVKLASMQGELFDNNNSWSFQTAVSDDRTNVLLIDQRPRWEFRYLRNLFDSRDKSVHLQHVLLEPDDLPGAEKLNKVASVGAKFGDSEASQMPSTLEEWMKFDVIILGDVIPSAMGAEVWQNIKQCVESRGATLVMIAGPGAMPHAYTNPVFTELCPVTFTHNTAARIQGPEAAYRLELTATGRSHVIFQQSTSTLENATTWAQMPELHWRNPVTGVKDNAEVLAYARPVEENTTTAASTDPAALTRQREIEKQQALAVLAPVGVGKVFFLSFDQSWRLRYGKGDVHHHRFWGQILRWGAGENLRAGNAYARLGTDQLTYTPGQPLRIGAKLIEQNYSPVADAKLYAEISQQGKKVSRTRLAYIPQSHGMYEAQLDATLPPGEYDLTLAGDEATRLAPQGVTTKFTIQTEQNPIEYGELSVDPDTANKLATLSGGKVVTPTNAHQLLPTYGPASKEKTDRLELRLWDNWILLATAVALLTAEWILRRRGGLA